jgi:hypothetical protein
MRFRSHTAWGFAGRERPTVIDEHGRESAKYPKSAPETRMARRVEPNKFGCGWDLNHQALGYEQRITDGRLRFSLGRDELEGCSSLEICGDRRIHASHAVLIGEDEPQFAVLTQ